jgi:AcrR family transcriptional regulator
MIAGGAKQPRERRTQEERREATIGKLLHAATEVLIEIGYADASVEKICARAGVSQGALFRHFATREQLMVAVGEDVGRKTLLRYRREFESLRDREDPFVLALRLVRDRCRSRLNQAWYELAMAARTSPSLRKGLRPVATRYYDDIGRLGAELLPELAAALGDRFAVLIDTIVSVFDGESVHRFVLPQPRVDDARYELLAKLAKSFSRPPRTGKGR